MKQFWVTLTKVFKAYSLEEKVLTLLALVLLVFFTFRGAKFLISPESIMVSGGVYTEGVLSNKPILINPLYVDFSQANRDVSSLVFSGLLKYDPQLRAFVEDLAALKISEDKKEYLFTLKDDLKWHDGEPLTADDVVFTFALIADDNFQNPLLKANFQGVQVVKIDGKNVKFVLNRPNSFFITNLNVGILPKHLLGQVAVADLVSNSFNIQPVGSGPYKVAEAVQAGNDGRQKVILTKFDGYYGVKPKISQIRFDVYLDEATLLRDKAILDIVPRVVGTLNQLVYDNRFTTASYSLPQYTAVFLNTASAKLKDLKLRIALVKLVNKDDLIKQLDNRVRVDTPLMELNQKDWLNQADLNQANGSLFDAGYKFKKDEKGEIVAGEMYRKDKDGKELELTMVARRFEAGSAQQEEEDKTLNFLVESWKKGGVKINLQLLDDAGFKEAIQAKSYDMVLAGQSMGYNLDTFPFWHSSQAKEGGLNLSNYKSFAADAQIEKIRETFDKDEKENRQKKLADVISKEVPALFLYRPNYVFLTDGKVKNINLSGLNYESDRFVNVASWCIGDECK